MKKSRSKVRLSEPTRAIQSRPEVTFAGSISNMAGGFDLFEMGSVRIIQRNLKREDFLKQYCLDIASIFNLTNAQQVMLKSMLGKKVFFEPFSWTVPIKLALSKDTGITVSHVDHCFRSLVACKKIIRKVKHGVYRLNSDYFFNPKELANADFLGVNIRYVFEPDTDAEVVLKKDKQDITLEDINMLIEIYNRKEKKKGQIKGMFEE